MPHPVLAPILAAAMLLPACTGGDGRPVTDDPVVTSPEPTGPETATEPDARMAPEHETGAQGETGTTTPSEMAFTSCTSDDYRIDHPQAWQTNPGDVVEACRVFHPGEIELEPHTDRDLHYAVSIHIDEVDYDRVREPSGEDEELSREQHTIAGRDAVAMERRSSGFAMVPEGERWYSYLVDLGDGRTLFATTYSVGETDYERDKAVLDRMISSLQLP